MGGWDGYGGAPPSRGGGYAGGWGYGYGGYDGGYQAPLNVGNRNWAENGDNEIRVGKNIAPGSSVGNNNRAGGSNIVTVGDNTPGGYGTVGYAYRLQYYELPY